MNAWVKHAVRLGALVFSTLVSRTDRYGKYRSGGGPWMYPSEKERGKPPEPLTAERLADHFRGEKWKTVGLLTLGTDGHGREAVLDIDAHVSQPFDAEANRRFAEAVHAKCVAAGLTPLVYGSDGKGGHHVRVPFAAPVPGWRLRLLGRWLADGWQAAGVKIEPESFPKQDEVGPDGCGNFVRLIGKHPKRDYWPAVFDGSAWVEGEAAVGTILRVLEAPNDPGRIPDDVFRFAERAGDRTTVVGRWKTLPRVAFNRAKASTFAEMVSEAGWAVHRQRPDGVIELTRPGKGEGVSATLGHRTDEESGAPMFFPFTTNSPFKPWRFHCPFAFYAVTEHGGDWKAAHDALAAEGFGERERPDGPGRDGRHKGNGIPPQRPPARGLAITCLSAVRPQPIEWLVQDYIPRGKLVLLAGDGGNGKSTLTLGLAAAVTRGRPAFGLDYPAPAPADVLLISCEDDTEDTVLPRLLAAGANLDRVRRVDGVPTKDGKPAPFSLADYERLEEELESRPNVRLVVIDPAGAYIGRSGVDEHKDADLRSLLDPLADLAARRDVAVVLVKHLNKGAAAKAVHKVGGSVGYVNAVRAAFVVAPHPDDGDTKLFLPIKFNLAPMPPGLTFTLTGLPEADQKAIARDLRGRFQDLSDDDLARLSGQLFRPEWGAEAEMGADEALGGNARKERADASRIAQAAEWLGTFLAEYARPSKEVFAEGAKAGFSRDNLYKAKAQAGVGASNKGKFRGTWHWGIGDPSGWKIRPEQTSVPDATSPNSPKSQKSRNSGCPSEPQSSETSETSQSWEPRTGGPTLPGEGGETTYENDDRPQEIR